MVDKLELSDFMRVHKYSLRILASFPLLFIFLASGEALQHSYESFLGMFNGLEQFRHFQNDPTRLSFGALKAFILLSALLTIPRVLFHFDKGYSALWLDKKALRKLINLFACLLSRAE
ncbi:MAG: hypothetical protein L3J65_12290 [Robiginitomaculum sp.]|nr:hypothetical protein [Robiginitomaculum sp.]